MGTEVVQHPQSPTTGVAPVRLRVRYTEPQSRLLLLTRWVTAIPLYLWLAGYTVVVWLATFAAFWAILATGKYPKGLFNFTSAYMARSFRVYAYFPLFMVDQWTPSESHPLTYEADPPANLSRFNLVFLKLPSLLLGIAEGLALLGIALVMLVSVPAWWAVLITGKFPRRLFDLNVRVLAWTARIRAWQWLMGDDYSLFGKSQQALIPVTAVLFVLLISVSSPWSFFSDTSPTSSGLGLTSGNSGGEISEAGRITNSGANLLIEGQWAEAITRFDQAILIEPEFALAYSSRGLALFQLGNIEGAMSDFDQAIVLNRELFEPWFFRGFLLQEQGRASDAIDDYDEAIRLNPGFVQAYNNRGFNNMVLDRYQEAVSDFDLAIELDPVYAQAYANRAVAYTILGQEIEATQDVEAAVNLGSDRNDLQAQIDAWE